MARREIIEADLTWYDGAFVDRVQVVVGEQGVIEQIGYLDMSPTLRLSDRALLPGMINAHSHAFQRGLRGLGESYSGGAGDFWSWRQAMYELVECLGPEEFRNLSRLAFEEMLRVGITTVGEFHYFHHNTSGDGFAFDQLILDAARDAGIRIVLLASFYAQGGIDAPLTAAQCRFDGGDVEEFCAHVAAMRDRVDGDLHRVGLSAHSIRAASPDSIRTLADFARREKMVFHLHAEEQVREVEECKTRYGATPVALLSELDALGDHVTLVHCTHTCREDIARIAESGTRVCICPLTEGNLGDGIADGPALRDAGVEICIGTDSNVRIGMNEEMRWLEYVQRVRHQRRGVMAGADGLVAGVLWKCATVHGARSLGLNAGILKPGCVADFFAIDVRGVSLLGATPESLLAAFIFGSGRSCVTHTCVGGTWHRWPGN